MHFRLRMGHVFVYVHLFFIFHKCLSLDTTTNKYDIITTTLSDNDWTLNKPRELSVLEITSNSFNLEWLEPLNNNGDIDGYNIYYMCSNTTNYLKFLNHSGSPINYNLTNLEPLTEYTIWVKAFNTKQEGFSSDSIVNTTDIAGPDIPIILNLTCQNEETIFLKWQRPNNFYQSLNYYYIYLYIGNKLIDNITLTTETNHLETTHIIKNVTSDTIYKVQIQASTESKRTGKILYSNISEPKSVFMQSDCDEYQEYMRHRTHELSTGVLAGVVCATFAFFLAILALVLWKKCFRASYYYLENPPGSVPTASLDWNATPDGTSDYKGPIPVHMFPKHVADLHADGDIGFSKEYELIQAEATTEKHASEQSQHPDNRVKNRYLNIIAYDHSRVQLLPIPGQKKNLEYINANYIDGFQWSKAYIGTQGPLPSTFDCFWRMIWEQRVSIIVMITNLVERGRRKCDMYWPKEGIETYGVIEVRLIREDVMATFTVRTLQIRHLRIRKKKSLMAEKTVYQYHYTNWPDHGTPDHPLPVLNFVTKSANANSIEGGPIVVHCSAGVGRTGTYIVLDAMLRQIKSRGEVNIFGFLKHIRCQRNFLVQTEEQYIFIHDALVEAIQSGETNISVENFSEYVQALQHTSPGAKSELWQPLDVQYKLATSFQCRDFDLISSNKVINQPKNRRLDILPVESYRVHLTPKPGEDGSDYVNATWTQGFHSLREFIITQHPLENTIKDFWQMVWDHNAQLIIMLSIIDQEFGIFWPKDQETLIEADSFKVKLVNEQVYSMYTLREFSMQSSQDDYEVPVKIIHCNNWPHECTNIAEMYHLPNLILGTPVSSGPIIVVDRFGGTEAASFCILTSLKKHIDYDNHVDVYLYAKLYHNRRPGIWNSVNDYLQLHRAVQSLCSKDGNITPVIYNMVVNGIPNGSVSNDNILISTECTETLGTSLGQV